MAPSESPHPDTRSLRSSGPVRTCVGCRDRAAKIELVRVVAGEVTSGRRPLVVDPSGAAAGRGAYLHPDPGCLRLALRRRAFGRALRVTDALDDSGLTAHFRELSADRRTTAVSSGHGRPRQELEH
ncbi:MAG: YlxR family protein [Nocardioides sp.]